MDQTRENTAETGSVTVTGKISKVIFKNDANGYRVISIYDPESMSYMTARGILPFADTGKSVTVSGRWVVHPRYGRQIEAYSCMEELPVTAGAMKEYLASDYVKGIGPRCAEAIVAAFGEDTFSIMDNDPDMLLKVEGIGPKRLEAIKKGWMESTKIRNIMVFLQEHGVSPGFAGKIYKAYGDGAIEKIAADPYCLADDIAGIGFLKADAVAGTFGILGDDPRRIKSGVVFTLKELSAAGHCFAAREMLVSRAAKLLEVDEASIAAQLGDIKQTCRDVRVCRGTGNEERWYLSWLYNAEAGCAERIVGILTAAKSIYISGKSAMETAAGGRLGVCYNKAQIRAIGAAAQNKVSIITGGPGTGKTTTVLGLISAFRTAHAQILLAAPTGRAAKRMGESCDMEAKTIHRLLCCGPDGTFAKNAEHPLEGDVLILDECSMIDIRLMYSLLNAVPDTMTVVLVGDIDQLPSVGPGNVLKDLINSGIVSVTRLEFIYRQGRGSAISYNAHRVNEGKFPVLTGRPDAEFVFIEDEEPESIADNIVRIYGSLAANGTTDVQVLSPMKKGPAGTIAINNAVQKLINPDGDSFRGIEYCFRAGDRVIQMRNNYEKGVFNGDIGKVTNIDREFNEMHVDFGGTNVVYDIRETDELSLAYAITVHKSQGSEYQYVIMPVTSAHYIMLQRNLIYTGMTRAKAKLIMVGTRKALYMAIKNNKPAARNTALSERLTGCIQKQRQTTYG